MDIAKIENSNIIITAQELVTRRHQDLKYQCPECNVELIASGGNERIRPYFKLKPNTNHDADCSFYIVPKELEFVDFVAGLLKSHPKYDNVRTHDILGNKVRYSLDLQAVRNSSENLIIECKRRPPLGVKSANAMLRQITSYVSSSNGGKGVICVPATFSEEEVVLFESNGVEVWDLNFLACEFGKYISKNSLDHYSSLVMARVSNSGELSQEDSLIQQLRECESGKQDWLVYQNLVGDILEYLFTPSLKSPISELSDYSKVNRRDFILPNYATSGFWAVIRNRYSADYIVVDAKNYSKRVGKKDVLQISNYLKKFGAGLFGMIVSRHGGDSAGCEVTLREQWALHGKLILVINDEHIVAMLRAKRDGAEPEDILVQLIQKFRLSM
uniref:HNH endonuclease n=1 Tax=Vibrio anguillarum TaxID=55601 RepID=UPI001E2E6327|nr:HNH endonuclease [Vibrio anguillarum]